MNKYVIVAIIAVTAYFFLIHDPYPETIIFQGHSLSSKENINDTLNDLDIFKYKDSANNHNFMLAVSNDEAITLGDLSSIYINIFERQGFRFKKKDNRRIGIKDDTVIYVAESKNIGGVTIYIAKSDSSASTNIESADDIFFDLESFSI